MIRLLARVDTRLDLATTVLGVVLVVALLATASGVG